MANYAVHLSFENPLDVGINKLISNFKLSVYVVYRLQFMIQISLKSSVDFFLEMLRVNRPNLLYVNIVGVDLVDYSESTCLFKIVKVLD